MVSEVRFSFSSCPCRGVRGHLHKSSGAAHKLSGLVTRRMAIYQCPALLPLLLLLLASYATSVQARWNRGKLRRPGRIRYAMAAFPSPAPASASASAVEFEDTSVKVPGRRTSFGVGDAPRGYLPLPYPSSSHSPSFCEAHYWCTGLMKLLGRGAMCRVAVGTECEYDPESMLD